MLDLTNPRSERVRMVRALAGRSVRQRRGLFLVEGPQAVREVLGHRPGLVRDLYLSEPATQRHPEIVAAAAAAGVRPRLASAEVLAAMSPDAQEVLGVAQLTEASLEDVVAARPQLVAILAHVRDPGNAGTVIRAADAAGADAVVLTESSVDVHNPKCVRSTAGSLFHLPVVAGVTLAESVDALRAAGLQVLAADVGGAHDLDALQDAAVVDRADPAAGERGAAALPDLTAPTAWLFGNEAWGLRPQERAVADGVVRVPIHGRAESLNLATAATLCLYASARAHRAAPTPRPL